MLKASNNLSKIPISDWILTLSIAAGLIYPPAFAGIIFAAAIRKNNRSYAWGMELAILAIAALYGLSIMIIRAGIEDFNLVLQHIYIWIIPFIITIYRPGINTVRLFSKFIFLLFSLDFLFNLYTAVTLSDVLGREIDIREGFVLVRSGGLFGHSFYSGSISIAMIATLVILARNKSMLIFPFINLLLAGSWRLSLVIVLVIVFLLWDRRNYIVEILMVALVSLLVVLGTLYTSGRVGSLLEENPSNTLRTFAWVTAIEKISSSPMIGIGYPKEREFKGVSEKIIDDSLIAESWYLSSSIVYGVPYTLLRLLSLIILFKKIRRTPFGKVIPPIILIDITYGGFFEGSLFYILLWIYATHLKNNSDQGGCRGKQVRMHYPLERINSRL